MTNYSPTQLLSIPHAAEVLDVSRGHVYHLIAAGKLRGVEIRAKGTRAKTRVYAADLETFISANTRRAKEVVDGEVRRVDGT